MEERIFDYDVALYDRRFLNCCQRHAVVWLGRVGAPIDLLFYNALPSSDAVMQQMVLEKKPKYSIECEFYSAADLESIGITAHEIAADQFSTLKELIGTRLAHDGFVLLSGNVFYFPHCPEYRVAHALHVVVLRGHDAEDGWQLVDDNHASVLCEYSYQEPLVRDFFENNTDRKLRYFDIDANLTAEQAGAAVAARFRDFIARHEDSHRFYDEVDRIVENPLDAPSIKYRALHDSFTVLSGSRSCFAKYLEVQGFAASIVEKARSFAQSAFVLKSLMVKAQITNKLKLADVMARCAQLKDIEASMLQEIRAAL